MSLDHWTRAKILLEEAKNRPPTERESFLDDACESNTALRAEVERLLVLDEQANGFFEGLRIEVDLAELPASSVQERIGPWRVLREVGRGGMGRVFEAERDDGAFKQRVAIKVVESGAPGLVERFRRERSILARLDHPHIARLVDGGTLDDGRPYLAMEFVEGAPISTYADEHRLSIDDRLALFVQVCKAVAFAHRNLVVHRDLKPGNILVATDNSGKPQVKLLDFGIASLLDDDSEYGSLTQTGQRLLTPVYAAPEQISGDAIGTATDVYALGVVLYELLAGRRPFEKWGRSRLQLEQAIVEEIPAPPSSRVYAVRAAGGVSNGAADLVQVAKARQSTPGRLRRQLRGDLDKIVLKAIRKEPERRYGFVEALTQDVERHMAGLPVLARTPTLRYRTQSFVRRHKVGVFLAAAMTSIFLIVSLWQGALRAYERYQLFPFADRVVDYDNGNTVINLLAADATAALQTPGLRSLYGSAYVSLGKEGILVLAFDDNVLSDGPGPDLVVWESGPSVERVDVAVSEDGETFFEVGRTEAQSHVFDLAPLGRPDAGYRFVRLRDVLEPGETPDSTRTAGADIDAILAVNGSPAPARPFLKAVAGVGRWLRTLSGPEIEDSVELDGGTYAAITIESGGEAECLAMCRAQGVCRAWTFASDNDQGVGQCQLKAIVARSRECPYCVSGIVRP